MSFSSLPHFLFYSPTCRDLYDAKLQPKDLLDLLDCIIRVDDRVANGPWILVDFVVVAAREGLVAKEVDGRVGDAVRLLGLSLEVA